jgi:SAM-dependent methyltransferase
MTIDPQPKGGNAMHTDVKPAEDRLDRTISPNDGMLAGNDRHYFSVGRSALLSIKRALACAGEDMVPPRRILDFPCGHGRVLRYLRAEFPQSEITACDLLEDGVDFCAATFGAIPVYSDPDPSRIDLPRNAFDLIWVGSLFTHFDAPRWTTFLSFMRDLLEPGGVVVFSTHGRYSHKLSSERPEIYGLDKAHSFRLLARYERTGFGYAGYQPGDDYGVSISDPAWVCRRILSVPGLRLVGLSEKAWDSHQDVFACVRDDHFEALRTDRRRLTLFSRPRV